jgi:SAM-dependent methyltransferase
MPEPRGPSAFVDEAYHLEDEAGMVEFYRKWAEDYDHQMLDELGYESPAMLAAKLREYLPDTAAAIFDIGCGTGLTCLPLAHWGYRELLVGDVNQPLERADASYHGIISTGTFTHGHVGPGPLDEIFRILEPGGVLACTVHRDLWESMGFEARFAALVDENIAACLERKLDRYYRDGEPEGWFCIYRKTA